MFHDPEFWILVAFVVFIVVAWKPGMAAVAKALDGRAERIRSDLDRASQLRKEAEALLAEYQKKQREALQEAQAIMAQAKAEAERLSAQAAADLEASLKRREQMAMQRIAQAEQQAVADVRGAAVDLAMAATSKLLAERLDAGRQDALIDGAIKELQGKLN
jgi:F-type H+-transporting ATPase subunit b